MAAKALVTKRAEKVERAGKRVVIGIEGRKRNYLAQRLREKRSLIPDGVVAVVAVAGVVLVIVIVCVLVLVRCCCW